MSPQETSAAAPKPPFDPLARHVDQETGLEYEDIAAKICGRPLESQRNARITSLTKLRYPKTAIKAYWQGYDYGDRNHVSARHGYYPDSDEHYERDQAGINAGKAAGCWGPADFKPVAPGNLAAHISHLVDSAMYAALSKGTGTFKVATVAAGSVVGKDFGVVTIDSLGT